MTNLIALIVWFLQALAPTQPDPTLTAYTGVLHAQAVIIATPVNTLEFEAVLGQNEGVHTRPPVSTLPPDWSVCHSEGCITPEVPIVWDVTCHAEFCHEPVPPGWERVPERP